MLVIKRDTRIIFVAEKVLDFFLCPTNNGYRDIYQVHIYRFFLMAWEHQESGNEFQNWPVFEGLIYSTKSSV